MGDGESSCYILGSLVLPSELTGTNNIREQYNNTAVRSSGIVNKKQRPQSCPFNADEIYPPYNEMRDFG